MTKRLSTRNMILALAFGMMTLSVRPETNSLRGAPAEVLAGLRSRDVQLDSALRHMGVKTLDDTAAEHRANQAFRLILSSSWGTDVFTMLKVGDAEIRFDKLKAPSGSILILDRGAWGTDRKIYSGTRTVRILTKEEAESIEVAMSTEQAERLASELLKMRSDGVPPVDGSITILEWLKGKEQRTLSHIPSGVPSPDSRLLGSVVTAFYALVK